MNISRVLELNTLNHQSVYTINTSSKLRVKDIIYENKLETTIKLSLLKRNEKGYEIQTDILDFKQTAKDSFSKLIGDLNGLSSQLVFQTDLNGNILQIQNKVDLRRKWETIKSNLHKLYSNNSSAFQLIANVEVQLQDDKAFDDSLKNKGIYAILFSGIYGYNYYNGSIKRSTVIDNYFNTACLPLKQITSLKDPENVFSPTIILERHGILDNEGFDFDFLKRTMKQIVGVPNFEVKLNFVNDEYYELNKRTGALVKAKQHLNAEVPGVYNNETIHELELKN